MTRIWKFAACTAVIASCSTPDQAPDYWMNGSPYTRAEFFSPDGESSLPRRGDVLGVSHWVPAYWEDGSYGGTQLHGPNYLRVATDAPLEFINSQARAGLILRKNAPASERVVAAWVDPDRPATVRSFLGLPDDQLKNLWGVTFGGWTDELWGRLAGLDLARTCIGLVGDECIAKAVRSLPKNLRFLSLGSSALTQAPKELARFRDLEFLAVKWGKFDASLLEGMSRLKYLSLKFCEVANPEKLERLKDLRQIDLTDCEGISRVEMLGNLDRLHSVVLVDTEVESLSGLETARALRNLDVEGARLRSIGNGFASLRTLNALRTPWSNDATAHQEFRRRHPTCDVRASHREIFLRAVEGADRLHVLPSPMDWPDRDSPRKPLLEVTNAADVRQLIDGIAVREDFNRSSHFCGGGPGLEFRREDQVLATLSLDHGVLLRWRPEWDGDTPLTDESAALVCAWLAARGIDQPQKELKTGRR